MEHKESFNLHFGKESHEIDARTLASSLSSFATLIDEVNHDLETNKKIKFKVKAFQQGSFDVPCELIEVVIAGALCDSSSFIPTILKTSWELVKIKANLGGKPAKEIRSEGNSTTIVSESGEITYVDNRTFHIFQNNTVAVDAVEKTFDAIRQDPEITDFKLTTADKEELIDIPKSDFERIAEKTVPEDQQKRIHIEESKLHLLKVAFDKKLKWEFYKMGTKIAAYIRDENFLERVSGGESFAKGDLLLAEVQINQVFDETLNTYINKSYEVLRVADHIPRNKQTQMEI
jgi:hypothetical protein